MCGIFGYVGNKNNAAELTLEALKKLEYRGYDSWGIGVEAGRKFIIDKHAGKIGIAKTNLPSSNFAFGHTRWATHGGVTDTNAHPHLDCTGKIAVVHNGIVENYQEIKNLLAGRHKIVSETDTELVAHLIEDFYYHKKLPLHEAVRQAFLRLRGLSAFLVAETSSKTLVAVKTGSPLVVGIGKEENMVGSDVNCLLSLTKNVIFIEDGQLAQITDSHINLFSVETGKEIKPKVQKVSWEETTTTKENFPYFMLKEIYEQPRILTNIMNTFDDKINFFSAKIKSSSQVTFVGCGTANYAGLSGTYLLSLLANKKANSFPGSEFPYYQNFLDKNSFPIFLSQSGETIDIVQPAVELKRKGLEIGAIVNNLGSTLYRLADHKILLEAGPEICVLSTKVFTAKLAILLLVGHDLGKNLAKGKEKLQKAIRVTNKILSKQYYKKYLYKLVQRLAKVQHIYIIGRGLSYPVALEAALKIKEVSYIHTEGFAGGELKHGVIALIEKNTPVIVYAPNDETLLEMLSNAMEIKARGGYIIGISHTNNKIFDWYLPVDDAQEATIIPNVVLAQLIGYHIAVLLGKDPDKPRNLAKSVTVK
ncbi:MAG: glutamine--fructose-6-phosphate transaminase (isomerizing) [Patescibacteria group bacterium]|nr:glutamine--fructose-6-phosphate transaminase (isomerizing) [Patescibacteria group bacterium]MCL5095357.1 glutamine--fructose-6-phosphate transaminase (isomerizing) [Patescibacteria group bacterium]